MSVKSFKLISGEELIASVVEVTLRGVKIKNPLVVHMMCVADGQPFPAFGRWSLIHKEGTIIELLTSGLVADPVEVFEEVEASYLSNVSGILVPPAPPSRILQG